MDLNSEIKLSPSMKMADLMDLRFNLVGVLKRLGIPFGFGDGTVEDVCRRQGIDPETFLLICGVHAADGFVPSREDLKKADLREVLRYLSLSHTYYKDVALKELSAALDSLTEPCGERHKNIIRKFFTEYKNELFKHLDFEESVVFPQAEAALRHGPFPSGTCVEKHPHMEEKLEDLKNLVMKYMPPECDREDVYRALSCIYALQEDLSRHIRVEDDILMAVVSRKMQAQAEGPGETSRSEAETLSAREKEILVCVAKGMLNKEIADQCNLSIHTVITHRKNITRKTGIKTVAGLTVYALLNNLIDINTVE